MLTLLLSLVTGYSALPTAEPTFQSPIRPWQPNSFSHRSCGPILSASALATTHTHYADFGAVLGQVAIVDDAPDTLISIQALADRGIETRSNKDLGVGLFLNDQLLY